MDKQKLFSITKRLSSEKLKSLTPTNIYLTLMTEFPYNEMVKSLSPDSIVLISFLIKYYSKDKTLEDVSKVIDNIQFNLFGFTLFEILSDEVEEDCDNCGGSGQESCYDCGGDGREDCNDCGGDGEDDEGNTCYTCDGDGYDECGYCDGSGETNCDNCDGTGYQTNTDESEIYQYFFISSNPKIKDFVFGLGENDKIAEESYHRIIDDNMTIQLSRKSMNASKNWPDVYGVGDFIFIEYTDEPTIIKDSNYLDIQNLPDM